MRTYSDFFKTLHDEQGPTGYLGRGTHYSVMRAVVFHDPMGEFLLRGQFADFAVVWDEDHDDRVIEPIEKIYRCGLLPCFSVFGERKGIFTAILTKDIRNEALLSELHSALNRITRDLEDAWSARIVSLDSSDNSIIDADTDEVTLYLNNLTMLWKLGVKAPAFEETLFSPALLKKVDELDLSVRAANCIRNQNIIYVGDLVQKTERELLQTPNFGRTVLNELKQILASMNLHFGMEVKGWPPKDIETLARRMENAA